MERFVHRQNLAHFAELLEPEFEPDRRDRVHALLIEEENRFGSRQERLVEAEGMIANCQTRVRRQQRLIADLRGDGQEKAIAHRVLGNMSRMLQLFIQYRDELLRE